MAIAGFVIQSSPDHLQGLQKALQNLTEVIDSLVVQPDRVAASLETPSLNILRAFKKINTLPGVLNLEIVYINYEDDLDRDGSIACPPLSELRDRE